MEASLRRSAGGCCGASAEPCARESGSAGPVEKADAAAKSPMPTLVRRETMLCVWDAALNVPGGKWKGKKKEAAHLKTTTRKRDQVHEGKLTGAVRA